MKKFELVGQGSDIFSERYSKNQEESWEEASKRVSNHVAQAEDNGKISQFADRFYDQLVTNKFMPGGRIWYGAGRPKAQLLNCLKSTVRVLTKEYGLIEIGKLDGQTVHVLSDDGKYRESTWSSYGEQELYCITFSNGDTIEATANHEWVVPIGGRNKYKRVKTIDLKGENIPLQHDSEFKYDDEQWYWGVRHGLTFGDGNLYLNGKFSCLNQFGNSLHLLDDFFEDEEIVKYNNWHWHINKLPSIYKKLPIKSQSPSYLRGFLAGLIAADGCVDTNGTVVLHNKSKDILKKIRDLAAQVGLPTISIAISREHSPYDGTSKPLYRLRFAKSSFYTTDDYDHYLVLKNSHKENARKSNSRNRSFIKVISVENTKNIETVYCCNEPETHTFVIEHGYLTGNCYVIDTEDSREGWGRTTSDTIVISGLMGGIGINMSPIRPRGTPIKGTGGVATGAVSLMQLINNVGNVIVGGGGRRMALMLCLDINHPDLEEFLNVKLDLKELNNANISLVIPANMEIEEFQRKIKDNEDIELEFNGILSGKKVNARELWDRLVKNAWESGEPGILNGYLANQMNNLHYMGQLRATNPCVTGDTWIHTGTGPKRVIDLVNKPYTLLVDNHLVASKGFFSTGVKPVYTLRTTEGYNLNLTSDHKILRDDGQWIEAGNLIEGDKIVLNNSEDHVNWEGEGTYNDGYIVGHFYGDGCWAHRPKLCSWGESSGEIAVRKTLSDITKQQWKYNGIHYYMYSSVPKEYLEHKQKEITDSIVKASALFQRGFLRGLFDTDGHVEGSSLEGGISIRLSQSNLEMLEDIQRMLLRFGIRSKLNMARETNIRDMPDGKGSMKPYQSKAQWRLIISSDCKQFMRVIGFGNHDKSKKFLKAQKDMKRGFYRKAFVATFTSLEYVGEEEVYDVQVPGLNAFDANGLYVHNCGEQWLFPYDACDLGALVLPRFVEDGNFDWDAMDESIRLGVRFLDDVLTVNHYPLPEIKETCEKIRRIGLGVMGLHTMLMELGMKYDDPQAFKFVNRLFNTIKNTAYDASINLAIEKGPFPAFDPRFLDSGFTQTLKRGIRNKVKEHGIRNCAIMTIAPTGTTSMVAGVSSGIEPLQAAVYWRNRFKATKDGTRKLEKTLVVEDAYYKYPELAQSAVDIPVESHFKMQKIVQKHIDNAVSKTIILSKDSSKEKFGDTWLEYLPYCKGTTVYRFGSRENEPINPVPKDQWSEVIAQQNGHVSKESTTFDANCVDGSCEILPIKEKIAELV